MPSSFLGSRDDQWAIDHPPDGRYWKTWTCFHGNVQNVSVVIWEGWPICPEGLYFSGPFRTEAEANAYFWDNTNPCAGANSGMGGGSGGAGASSGGGARFYYPRPPSLKLDYGNYGIFWESNPPSTHFRETCCGPHPIYVNGQPKPGKIIYNPQPSPPTPPPGEPEPPGNTVPVPCCPGGAPTTINITFSDGVGTCACLNGKSTTITYNGDRWSGTLSGITCPGGASVGIVMRCFDNGIWGMMIGGTEQSASVATCNPFYLQFAFGFPPLGAICNSSVIVEVTGGPANPPIQTLRYIVSSSKTPLML